MENTYKIVRQESICHMFRSYWKSHWIQIHAPKFRYTENIPKWSLTCSYFGGLGCSPLPTSAEFYDKNVRNNNNKRDRNMQAWNVWIKRSKAPFLTRSPSMILLGWLNLKSRGEKIGRIFGNRTKSFLDLKKRNIRWFLAFKKGKMSRISRGINPWGP